MLDATLPWALVFAAGIGFLALVIELALRHAAAPDLPAALRAPLAELAVQLPPTPPPTDARRELQRRLERLLAASPTLDALDWVSPDGLVWLSTEPSAVGRPATEGARGPELRLPAAGGGALRVLLARSPAADEPALSAAGVLALALLLPAAALAWRVLRPPVDPPSGPLQAARQRLQATRERLARASHELEGLEAAGAAADTTVVGRAVDRTQAEGGPR